MLDFRRFRVLTFDCYGTLVDWESGILGALRPLLRAHGKTLTDEQTLEIYGELEAEAEAGEYHPYREVLEGVVRGFGRRLGFEPSLQEAESLPESLKNWKPFPDTVAALMKLKARYKLAVVSNVDDDLFAATARRLEVPFDWVITAQQAGSYKPSHRNFKLALERIALPPDQVLHVAQSIYHDIVPARELGLATVWVNRRAGKAGEGATKAAQGQPDLEVPDLKTLAEMAVH
ncbi:MAG: haloacid dehalogenase type II [Terriglobales bacterium]